MLKLTPVRWAANQRVVRSLFGKGDVASQPTSRPTSFNPQWVQCDGGPLTGHYLYLDLQAAVWQPEMMHGEFDAFIYKALQEHTDLQGKVVWDIGAHIGYHTLGFASLVGQNGKVVAFEPNPRNLERIRLNLDKNPDLAERVITMSCALADKNEEIAFVICEAVDDGSSSGSFVNQAQLEEVALNPQEHTQTTVPSFTADSLAQEGRVPAPDVLKIDVEGAEWLVLEGAKQLLATKKPSIIVEVHNILMMYHIQRLLLPLGYDTKILDEGHTSISRCHLIATAKGNG